MADENPIDRTNTVDEPTPADPIPPTETPITPAAPPPPPAPVAPPPPPAPAVSKSQLDKAWPYVGMFVLGLVFAVLLWFLFTYANTVGYAKLATIEGTRPLLTVAAIISTIIFGGALLLGSLFSSEGTFEDRFRHAREIFLVFSGVFGTVIGFYFGAGDNKDAVLGVDATLQDTTIVAYATGGSPPYKLTITYGPKDVTKTEDSKTGWARFTLDKTKDNIFPLKLTASDSRSKQGSGNVSLVKDELKAQGWQLPE
jgi:hypothetical protein